MYDYNFDITGTSELILTMDDGERIGNVEKVVLTSSCSGDNVTIGGVFPSSLSVTVKERVGISNRDFTSQVDYSGNVASLGAFRCATCDTGDDSTTITAYDALYWATGGTYTPTVSSGSTVAAVLSDLATQIGVTLDTLPASASTTHVTGTLTGYTLRDMLGYMAGLVGRNAVLTRENKLKLVWFTQAKMPPDKLGSAILGKLVLGEGGKLVYKPSDYYESSLTAGSSYYLAGIHVEVPQTSGDPVSYDAGSGTGMVMSVANPFMTQSILNAIWSDIGGLSGNFGTLSVPYAIGTEAGDIIGIENVAGDSYNLLASTVTLNLDGGCKVDVSSSGQSVTESGAAFQGSIGKTLTKVQADIAEFGKLTVKNDSGQTEIDGGKIKTGSIEADSIKAGAITSDKISAGSVTLTSLDASVTDEIDDAKEAAEDAQDTADAAKSRYEAWTYSGTTKINGAMIETGTILAENIAAGTLYGVNIEGDNLCVQTTTKSYGSAGVETGFDAGMGGRLAPYAKIYASDSSYGTGSVTFELGCVYIDGDCYLNSYPVVTSGTISGYLSGYALKSDIPSVPTIKTGSTSQISLTAGGYVDTSISYSGFSSTPTVLVSLRHGSTSAQAGNISAFVLANSVSTSGCTVRITSSGTAAPSVTVDWIAIG